MSDGQYILPSELVLLLGFVLLPAILLAVTVQAAYFAKKNTFRVSPGKTAIALITTVILGVALAIAAFTLAPAGTGHVFGIRNLSLFGLHLPVWPLGFAVLGASALVTTRWLVQNGKSAA